jgi:hypothetical protein
MTPQDFIASARKLLAGQPSDVDIRRAVSAAYYGMFHQMSGAVFSQASSHRGGATLAGGWVKVYRSADHRALSSRCNDAKDAVWAFSQPIVSYAEALVRTYKARIDADYDPSVSLVLSDAALIVDLAELAIAEFDAVPDQERRAFVLFVSLRALAR